MPKKQRDYSNLKESERVWDAVDMNSTHFKDYALNHLCGTAWRIDKEMSYQRYVHVYIGDQLWIGRATILADQINGIADGADEDNWFPRTTVKIRGVQNNLMINTKNVNNECLQDHVAEVTIGDKTAIVDLEELLKATRYA